MAIFTILRRVLFAFGLLAGAFLALDAHGPLLRISVSDIGKMYESQYAPRPRFGAMEAAHELIRRDTPYEPLAVFVDRKMADRTIAVEGPAWNAFFSELEAANADRPSADWQKRRGSGYADGSFFFKTGEAPLNTVFPVLRDKGMSFTYLRLPDATGPRFADLVVTDVSDASTKAPPTLLYIYRSIAPWFAAGALAAYILLPWPRRLRPDAIRYTRATSVVLPDILAGVVMTLFFAMPMFIVAGNSSSGSILDFADEGWGIITAALWLLAAIFASIFVFTARYEAFQLVIEPMGLQIVTIKQNRTIPFSKMERIEFADFRPPRWLRILMFIGGMVNWRLMGQALLLESRRDWGITIVERDGRRTRMLANFIPDFDRVFKALKKSRIPFDKTLTAFLAGS